MQERQDPFVLAACLDRELIDEFVQGGCTPPALSLNRILLLHELSFPCFPHQRVLARSRNEGSAARPAPAAPTSKSARKPVLRWCVARMWRTVSAHSAPRPARASQRRAVSKFPSAAS